MVEKKSRYGNLLRFPVFFAGMFVSSFGVALSTKAALGISPISALPYVVSELLPITMGQTTIILHCLFILGQILLLRKNYKLTGLFQLPMAFFYGYFIDFSVFLLRGVAPETYPGRFALCIVSVFILALGVFMTVNANLIMLAGEGFDSALAQATGMEFGRAKILMDCVLVVLAAVISLASFGTLVGLREGTFIAAVAVGLIVQVYNTPYRRIRTMVTEGGMMRENKGLDGSERTPGKPHIVVTITRDFDPNAVKIARRLSEMTGLKLYDSELVDLVIEESGLDAEFVRKNEEYLTKGILQMLYANSFKYPYLHQSEPKEDILFRAQKKVIRRIASQEDCIILGRNANRTLGKSPYNYHIFLHSNPEWRINECMREFHLNQKQAAQLVNRTDRQRRAHCFRCTGRPWGLAFDFNLCLDVARYGVEKSAEIIRAAIVDYVYSPKLSDTYAAEETENHTENT